MPGPSPSPAQALPAASVTFLFTDVEGSTRLLGQYPQAYSAAIARHNAILQAAVEAHRGYVFETVGDAFYAAFSRPADAVAAALKAQLDLQAERWGEVGQIKVRMGLHTGPAELRGGRYVGPPVFRCARLMSVAHGAQVVLSAATADLVRAALPEGATLRDLGTHRLRELPAPERIFQLLHPALPSEFPPLKSLSTLLNNLPVQLTSFVGRERELAEVKRLLGASHLVTLTGVGGTGKTRLALQVATELADGFPDGVWWVELAGVEDPLLVPRKVASAVSVREESDRPVLAALVEHLRPKQLLLVLDRCEQWLAACASLADSLLRACPHLRILATSREVLGVAGEVTLRVPPLLGQQVAEDWGYELLSPAERALLNRLSVFRDGCTLEAAEAVCGDAEVGTGATEGGGPKEASTSLPPAVYLPPADILDLLSDLVEKSLVVAEADAGGAVRYRMLETLREYGQERLAESGEAEVVRRRHAEHFLALAEQAEPELTGPRQTTWLQRLERERENLRVALGWLEAHGAGEAATRIRTALGTSTDTLNPHHL